MEKFGQKKEPNLNIFYIYILVIVVMDLIFYPLFPLLLNYPPGSINTQFDIEFSGIAYYQQYIIINLLVIFVGYICLKFVFKDVQSWKNIKKKLEINDYNAIIRIRQKSYKTPYLVCVLQILIPIILVGILFLILGFRNIADIKFFMLLATFLSLVAVISYLFSKKYFREILKYTYIDVQEPKTKQICLQSKITLQILPLFLFSIIFTLLIGQSGLVREKGNLLFENYLQELKTNFKNILYVENEEQIKQTMNLMTLKNKKDIIFYIDPVGRYNTSDNSKLSDFFLKYTRELAFKFNGHTYDYYGLNIQGAVIKLLGVNGEWIIGIRYVVSSPLTSAMIVISFVVLSLLAIFILIYFGKTITDDITIITSGLREIVKGDEDLLDKKIPVTSNDEIGDLAIAFNKVQEHEKNYIQDIRNQQKIIVEQEKLASLGQMISGITHNLKTPIISLSVAIQSLKDLVTEYQKSVSDPRVTKADHQEIALEMGSWLMEMKPYCDYMNDVLSTIKGQITQNIRSEVMGFALKELLKRVEIITHYELSKSLCTMNYDIKTDLNLLIPGEISDLVQVLANLISNSIQAYQGKGGIIDFMVTGEKGSLEFQIKDTGSGIPERIKTKLFKEIITTKGKKGTGLGLYISSAIIKGKFCGEIWFESTEGKGSVFNIRIPTEKKGV